MDAVALRTEIKAWERDFKVDNGRDPTIQDIKDRPDLGAVTDLIINMYRKRRLPRFSPAEKYKLYKKLNKAKTQPSTPPKRQSKQLISKSQAVKVQPPVASTNPFSPVKNKGNRGFHVEQTRPLPNLFSTPRKEARRELSPDPFPLIQPVASSSQVTLSPQPTSAVSRARKRLRGEPVSPSPVKPKRPRVVPTSGPIPFLGKRPFDSDEEPDYSYREFGGKLGPSSFEETPRKDRLGGKSFTSLFNEDDRLSQLGFDSSVTTRSPSAVGPRLFRTRSQSVDLSSSNEDDDDGPLQARTQLRTRRKSKPSNTRSYSREKAFNVSSRLTSSKGNNILGRDSPPLRTLPASATSGAKSDASTTPSTPDYGVSKLPPTSSAPTSDAEMYENSDSINDDKNKISLVPVSPPPPCPTSANGHGNSNMKGKGKRKTGFTSGARKWKGKGKASGQIPALTVAGDDSQDEALDDGGSLPVLRIYQGRNTTPKLGRETDVPDGIHDQEEGITEDLVTGIKRRIAFEDQDLPHLPPEILPQDGDMAVNLRDEFRTILDLNANAAPLETAGAGINAGGRREYARHARVVRAVREGTRVFGMFDPSRGGHIWGVGETGREADADLGTEDFQAGLGYGRGGGDDSDDWEGEGVPWEVAELEHGDDETRL